ncbi:hypothetical protein M8J77_013805 [Diaphorina citri]|nr:hypothetical protein M8J77_013805 [Diaphorina citri]
MADTSKLSESEYSVKFFGYSTLTVQQDFERKLISLLNSNIKALQKKLSEKCKTDQHKQNLEKCMQKFKDTFQNNLKGPLEGFNTSISELFKIAPHVLFPEDEVYRNYSEDSSNNIDEEVKELENNYRKTQLLTILAQGELKMLKEIECAMQDVSKCRRIIENLNKTAQIWQEVLHS